MKYDKIIYIILFGVFALSVLCSIFIPTTEAFKGVISTPAVVSLLSIIFQIFRDQSAFEKEKYFDIRKRIFEIGATSHMANTAFDKHVEFCEKYMAEVHETVGTLFREGPSQHALKHANKTHLLRQEYAAWLTDEINSNLAPYEQAVREIGAWSTFIDNTTHSPQYAEKRAQKIDEIFKKFNQVLGLDQSVPIEETHAIESVKKKVREILGIEELTKIRKYLVKEAVSALESSN